MRKIINVELESVTENDIKRYTIMLNNYFRRKWRYVFILLLMSCSVQNEISKDDFKNIPKDLSGSFYDKLDTIGSYDDKVFTRSLLKDLTDLETINYAVPIKIEIKKKSIFFTVEDDYKKQIVLKFYGKRYKNRFVFYKNYKTVSFPFLLMSKEMEKYRVYLTSTNEILFANNNENTGMLLFFGAGSSSNSDFQFKLFRNE